MFTKLPYGANFIDRDELDMLDDTLEERILFRYQRNSTSNAEVFERVFSEAIGMSYGLATPNCTSALRLALLSTQPRVGERVAIPAVTFIATAGAVLSCGLVPYMVSVDQHFCMEIDEIPDDIERVIAVHVDGFSAPIPKKAFVIEDCAQGLGITRSDGSPVGTGVHAAAFSFQHNKLLSSGTGGILCTNSKDVWQRARDYHDHGSSRQPGCYPVWKEDASFGENMMANELVTAVQLQQARRLTWITDRLHRNYNILADLVSSTECARVIPRRPHDVPLTLRIQVRDQSMRDACLKIFDEQGVPYWTYDRYLLPKHPVVTARRSIYSDGFPWSLSKGPFQGDFNVERLKGDLARTLAVQVPPQYSAEQMIETGRAVRSILETVEMQATKRHFQPGREGVSL
jgi:dTDP-4-amino-4,6-dideoxygalactose transaminase